MKSSSSHSASLTFSELLMVPSKPSFVSSSPSRSEKLPTPGFARLLRRNGCSRSRNQTSLSRSSPLFPSRNPNHGNEAEPSSPKVTCIGQVRIRKPSRTSIRPDSKQNRTQLDPKKTGRSEMRCCFFDKSLFPNIFRSRKSIWRRWLTSLRFKGNAVPRPLNDLGKINFRKSEREDLNQVRDYDESETRVFVPPKNALILMRCRSAPHNRSSLLATRTPACTKREVEDEAVKGTENSREEDEDEEEEEEEEENQCVSSRALFLKRCKSEPATKAAKLVAHEPIVTPLKF